MADISKIKVKKELYDIKDEFARARIEELAVNGGTGETGADGKSAYQIWLDQGNTGSEQDFLNSLKGADGKDGTNGVDGKDGQNGKDGYTPVKGVDYFTEEDLNSLNIPTKTSQLENDSKFASESYVKNEIANAQLGGDNSDIDLSGLATKDELNNKVDKVAGKSLIDDTEITRLASVHNYDDTEIKNQINSKASISDMTNYIEEHKDELKGEQGIQGVQGEQGIQGEKGDKGDKGDTGEQGKQGIQGVQGEKGEKGDKGDTGADGTNGQDGVSATHSWNGTALTITSASGTSSADLKGEKGDKGDAGSQGIQGEQGLQGEKGEKGDKGDTGATGKDGVSPTITTSKSGKVTTLTITDVNGTKTATINDGADGTSSTDTALAEEVAKMKEQQPNLFSEAVQTGNLLDNSIMADGYYINSSGTTSERSTCSYTTDFVDISKAEGTHLAIYAQHKSFISNSTPVAYLNYAQGAYRMCFYDENKTKISYVEAGGGKISDGTTLNETVLSKTVIEIPSNAVYVKVSFTSALTTTNINKYMIVRGSADMTLPNYSDYSPPKEHTVVPEDLNEKLASIDTINETFNSIKISKHQDNAEFTVSVLNNSATFCENDFTFVKDELWLEKQDDAYTNGTRIFRYKVNGSEFTYIGYIDCDFGHLNVMDYCEANDCLIFGNGANDKETTGNYFVVVPNPLSLPVNGNALIADVGIKYDVDVGYKVQALWGDSNLGDNNIVYLLSNSLQSINKILLKKDSSGNFDGTFITLETKNDLEEYGIQGADIWGDTLYVGGQVGGNGNYSINEVSLTDYTSKRKIIRQFYEPDGTLYDGCVQGIYVDHDSVWVCINATQNRTKRCALTKYRR